MDTTVARKMWRTLEPFHGMIYFAPEAAGLDYFAARAAAMGPVPATVVLATFFNFSPQLVHRSIPHAWSDRSPAAWLEARYEAADQALRRLVPDAVDGGATEAAALARDAASACTLDGRPLFAGHASLPWPGDDQAHLVLWHAITLLREFRGDGHVAALVAAGLSGCEALVMHGASGDVAPAVLQSSRGWTDDEWRVAVASLVERGWVDGAGALTDDGRAARDRYEALTDELAMAPWEAIGDEACDRLRELVRPFSKAIVAGGVFGAPPRPRPA